MSAISNEILNNKSAESAIREMFLASFELKAKYGEENVFDLSMGNPVMEPPAEFKEELMRQAASPEKGLHRYMLNSGYPETRAAVARQLEKETGFKFTWKDIVMTSGCSSSLNITLKSILNPGEEIIMFAPFWGGHATYTKNWGGVPRVLESDEQFLPRLDLLEETIGPMTKAVLINSPNNPTGAVVSEEILARMGDLLAQKEKEYRTTIFLINDEVYRKIMYDGEEFPTIWKHHPNTIVATSHSKDLGLAGERIGYVAINPECEHRVDLADAMEGCVRSIGYVCAPALIQRIVANLQDMTIDLPTYQRQRDFMCDNLESMGYSLVRPKGALYIFPRSPIDDMEFTKELRVDHRVLVVAGTPFHLKGHFRISICTEDRGLKGSLKGFRAVAEKYGLL